MRCYAGVIKFAGLTAGKHAEMDFVDQNSALTEIADQGKAATETLLGRGLGGGGADLH